MIDQRHAPDDDLVLLFYGELPEARAREVEAHLRTCPSCRAAWTELGDTLAMVDRAETPEPAPGFERVLWARLREQLPRRRRWTLASVLPVTAAAAVVALVVGLTGTWRPAPAEDGGVAGTRRARVLDAAIDDHLAQTERLLVELLNAPADADREWAFERAAASDLLASGRLYRMTASETGNAPIVEMLDQLEPVLVEVARRPAPIDPSDRELLRARIDEQGLLFKVRAASYEMRPPR